MLDDLARRIQAQVRQTPQLTGESVPTEVVDYMPDLDIDLIKDAVDRRDRVAERQRRTEGEDHWLHVSSVQRSCPRELALHKVFGVLADFNEVRGADRIVWTMGRAAEHHVRTAFIQASEYNYVYGGWTCQCENTYFEGYFPKLLKCNRCDGALTRYKELALRDPVRKLVGSPDFLYNHFGYMVVVEIKSMNKKDFDKLMGPKSEHIQQSATYRRLLMDTGVRVHSEVVVYYVCKDYAPGSPYKEFHEDATALHIEGYVNTIYDNAEQVTNSTLRSLPPRLALCGRPDTTRASGCAMCVRCFSVRDYDE